MQGESRYYFEAPQGRWQAVVQRPDGYAPNDADLERVRRHMEGLVQQGESPLAFTIEGPVTLQVRLTIISANAILSYAVKPLQDHERIHR